ncbi:MAG: restriction endonuclease [Bacteroidales bacterium]|nr:restriction endonuclease [Bacteroidales bacterium]
MKLEKILDQLNSFEKNSFLKVITTLIDNSPKKSKDIERILSDTEKDLKNVDIINIVKVFNLIENEFANSVRSEFVEATSQLDIIIDILIRDGNCIMSREWLNNLYEKEIRNINTKIKEFEKELKSEKSDISELRKRDYRIYRECLNTAYFNDELNNLDCKVTSDEQSILNTLSKNLGLSHEETKLINYLIVGLEVLNIDTIINEIKNLGIIFYSKKSHMIYVADEVVRVLRGVRGKEVADKYFRRVLKNLREPQINLIARKHNIDKHQQYNDKIKSIINEGISFRDVLSEDIYKEGTTLNDKKGHLNDLFEKDLKIMHLKGVVIEDKLDNIIKYFESIDRDDKVGISVDGYEKLLIDINKILPSIKALVKNEFEFQEEDILRSKYLLDYNIKPRDILDLIPEKELKVFCEKMSLKIRGSLVSNILESYKDAENLYIENYENIAYRKLNELKENGLNIKESELGIKFEDITKNVFSKLGFEVDEKLRKKINNAKNKVDLIINLGNSELIIVECKTVKESGYNKFSSVSRQIKAYIALAKSKDFRVVKSLLIAPEFSEDFEKDCREEFELNLSLISAKTLVNILIGFKSTKHKQFPYQLLMKDVLIKEDWILKAINK